MMDVSLSDMSNGRGLSIQAHAPITITTLAVTQKTLRMWAGEMMLSVVYVNPRPRAPRKSSMDDAALPEFIASVLQA